MDADSLIRELMWHFPRVAPNRSEALIHIMHGGGYFWQQGEIVADIDFSVYETERPQHTEREAAFAAALERTREWEGEPATEQALEDLRRRAYEQADLTRHVRENIDSLLQELPELEGASAFSEFSPLANIPEDASESWLVACEQTAQLLLNTSRSSYDRPCDREPVEKPSVESLERRNHMRQLVAEVMGGSQEPITMEQLQAEYEQYEAESALWRKADKNAVARNHQLARQAVERVAQIRAARASASA